MPNLKTAEWLIVTERKYWGCGNSIAEAANNACLPLYTELDWWEGAIGMQSEESLSELYAEGAKCWEDYGRDEYDPELQETIAFTLYRMPERGPFSGFNVCNVTGAASFLLPPGSKDAGKDLSDLVENCTLRAYWKNGRITKRSV